MKQTIAIIFALVIAVINGQSEESKLLVDLRGMWKFEAGDDKKWSDPKYDDSKWKEIFAPSDWEDEGIERYDGYGWYRKDFTLPQSAQQKMLYIHLVVDDVCGVYINGNLIGEGGRFPPRYETQYNVEHKFFIPAKFLRYNQQNIIAVRVYDDEQHGGIVGGRVGIHEYEEKMEFVMKFPESWKFEPGDEEEWKEPGFDDSKWQNVIVPATWDFQGYRNYDGFGWYRVVFNTPANLKDEDLVLLLGKIDDIDEAYLNGELIGRTGRIRSDGSVRRINDEYQRFRGYRIPRSTLKIGEKNVLAVRVYDRYSYGGIYQGPIGIVKAQSFRDWESTIERNYRYYESNTFERILNRIFSDY